MEFEYNVMDAGNELVLGEGKHELVLGEKWAKKMASGKKLFEIRYDSTYLMPKMVKLRKREKPTPGEILFLRHNGAKQLH